MKTITVPVPTIANRSMQSLKRILLPIALGFGIVASANANLVTVTSPIASATIATEGGGVGVVLSNNIQNPSSYTDILIGFSFTLSDDLGMNFLVSSGGPVIRVQSDGTYIVPYGDASHWNLSTSGNKVTLLGSGRGIIGFSDAGNYTSGAYSAADDSLVYNSVSEYNDFLESGAIFNFVAVGVTASTMVTSATFTFAGNDHTSVGTIIVNPTSVPDSGSTGALLGLGLPVLAVARRMKKGVHLPRASFLPVYEI